MDLLAYVDLHDRGLVFEHICALEAQIAEQAAVIEQLRAERDSYEAAALDAVGQRDEMAMIVAGLAGRASEALAGITEAVAS